MTARGGTMRFGVHHLNTYFPELDGTQSAMYRHLFEQVQLAEEVGFDDVWFTEHHFHEFGGLRIPRSTKTSRSATTIAPSGCANTRRCCSRRGPMRPSHSTASFTTSRTCGCCRSPYSGPTHRSGSAPHAATTRSGGRARR